MQQQVLLAYVYTYTPALQGGLLCTLICPHALLLGTGEPGKVD